MVTLVELYTALYTLFKNPPVSTASEMSAKSIHVMPNKQATLYRLNNSKNWHVRIKYKDKAGYWKKSTGTADFDEAWAFAIQRYTEINSDNLEIRRIHRSGNTTLEDVAREFLKNRVANKNDKTICENYLIPKIGNTIFAKLKYPDLEGYINSCDIRSESTYINHKTTINKLLRFGIQNDYIKTIEHLKLQKSSFKDNFSRQTTDIVNSTEWDTLCQNYSKWRGKSRGMKVYEIRHKLFVLMQFLLFTGIRPGEESEELQYKNFEFTEYKGRLVAFVDIKKGKMKDIKPRKIPIHEDAAALIFLELNFQCFEDLPKIQNIPFNNEADRANALIKLNPERKFFYVQDKRPEYARNFGRYIQYLKDEKLIDEEKKIILYSMRHTFITNELYRGKDIYAIAKHCGNSVQMIEKYYSKYESAINAKEVWEDNFKFYRPN